MNAYKPWAVVHCSSNVWSIIFEALSITRLVLFHQAPDRNTTTIMLDLLSQKSFQSKNWFQFFMLDENVSPAADQPESRAVGQPL
eukprot:scaffold132525_cov17-Tisochrysis_lutea.AAC.1